MVGGVMGSGSFTTRTSKKPTDLPPRISFQGTGSHQPAASLHYDHWDPACVPLLGKNKWKEKNREWKFHYPTKCLAFGGQPMNIRWMNAIGWMNGFMDERMDGWKGVVMGIIRVGWRLRTALHPSRRGVGLGSVGASHEEYFLTWGRQGRLRWYLEDSQFPEIPFPPLHWHER